MKKEYNLFVYGTLKDGFTLNPFYLNGLKPKIKKCAVKGTLFGLGNIPAITFDKEGWTMGEMFVVPEEEFFTVKKMEENASYFTELVDVYVPNEEEKRLIKSGEKAYAFFMDRSITDKYGTPCELKTESGVWVSEWKK